MQMSLKLYLVFFVLLSNNIFVDSCCLFSFLFCLFKTEFLKLIQAAKIGDLNRLLLCGVLQLMLLLLFNWVKLFFA